MVMYLEENGSGSIQTLSLHLSGENTRKALSQDSRCPETESNQVPPERKFMASPLRQII